MSGSKTEPEGWDRVLDQVLVHPSRFVHRPTNSKMVAFLDGFNMDQSRSVLGSFSDWLARHHEHENHSSYRWPSMIYAEVSGEINPKEPADFDRHHAFYIRHLRARLTQFLRPEVSLLAASWVSSAKVGDQVEIASLLGELWPDDWDDSDWRTFYDIVHDRRTRPGPIPLLTIPRKDSHSMPQWFSKGEPDSSRSPVLKMVDEAGVEQMAAEFKALSAADSVRLGPTSDYPGLSQIWVLRKGEMANHNEELVSTRKVIRTLTRAFSADAT